MDSEIKSDLARLEIELKAYEKASKERAELSQIESLHKRKVEALLQLIVDRAVQVRERPPESVIKQAVAFSIQVPKTVLDLNINEGQYERTYTPSAQFTQAAAPAAELYATNKTSFVRQYILWSQGTGVSPSELKHAARQLGKLPNNFPYTILGKLKSNGEIKEEGGRYFPVDQE